MAKNTPNKSGEDNSTRRSRKIRNFPAAPFEDALEFAKSIFSLGAGQPVRRLTLFDELGKSPESGPSRQLITNSGKYGLTAGSYASETISLTELGKRVADEATQSRERKKIEFELAINNIEPFKGLYDKCVNNKLPAKSVLIDSVKEFNVDDTAASEAVDTFIVNLRGIGLLRNLSGAERIVTLDHLLDTIPSSKTSSTTPVKSASHVKSKALVAEGQIDFEKTAFYIAPIGEEQSEFRKHSDLFLSSIVEPAIEEFGLHVVRADQIGQAGIISRQIIEYIMKSKLVVADLSFHNPNVFYELAIRHMVRKPVVQIMRKVDHVPFDVSHVRTISIDTTDIYTLVPSLERYKSEISSQVRSALDDPDSVDNPISQYFPAVQASI